MKELLMLKDGALINIKDDSYIDECGCPTCGLDTVYINNIEFEFRNAGRIVLQCRQYEDYFDNNKSNISVGEMIRIFVDNYERFQGLTEIELIKDIQRILEDMYEDIVIGIEE